MIVGVMKRSHWNKSRNSNIGQSPKAKTRTGKRITTSQESAPEPRCGQDRSRPMHRLRVEIAANCGHNRASRTNPASRMTLCFEDFPPGRFGSYGPRHVTREEMLAFAAEFDPQPMHLDEAAASGSMRMMFAAYVGRTASLGAPGVNELKWLAPLRPGDDLMLEIDVVEARVSRSR